MASASLRQAPSCTWLAADWSMDGRKLIAGALRGAGAGAAGLRARDGGRKRIGASAGGMALATRPGGAWVNCGAGRGADCKAGAAVCGAFRAIGAFGSAI